ncbi:7TM diverse intracellular signaling domain-containing protein [Pedobacter aquatilis]|uniref:7TM diverse intracellular signaling domain-containing protein n=1 Tax=Pedobacter aquatilis TaxID=351343 RepID=UPI0025B28237|nr:7TM diverse intracellular signaling domain-containing protein [Pedobacter aquatilis]MDN3588512.1 7TM diverse intracellular signaling domain-containing protein [Pedobacter aquatilis]
MIKSKAIAYFISFVFFTLISAKINAQIPLAIDDDAPHQIFTYNQIDILEDKSGKLNLKEVLSHENQALFKPSLNRIPKNENHSSTYWYRFKINHNALSANRWVLEFFDQSIADLTLYTPNGKQDYQSHVFGTGYNFSKRVYQHKNFTFDLINKADVQLTYYVRIKSPHSVSAIIVLRDLHWFVGYALGEYFIFGLFYGMIIVFCLYNLLMYFAIKGKQYLFYVLYNLSIGLYEMCNDGIAFQYLWPNFPLLNIYGFGVALFLSSIFGMLFTLNFLFIKAKSPAYYKVIVALIVLRSLFFIACLFYTPLFNFKIVEFIPLLVVFMAGFDVYRKGYKPALFLIIGYGFLVAGFSIKILLLLKWLPYGPLVYYSLSICFVIEMVIVSFAIGNSIRTLRKKKSGAQKRVIEQLRLNDKLNQTLNAELSILVEQRTEEIQTKAQIIEQQNLEISLMNSMLKKDNNELNLNITRATKARLSSKMVEFEEFSRIYPDKEHCYKYIAELKWSGGYCCKRCTNQHFLTGQTIYSRRCTKCGYDESVTANTLFQNSRIPINKALYMLFLVCSSKGTISSYKLSQLLSIRQSTCWTYNSKMQKLFNLKKDEIKKAGEEGWSKLLLTEPI